MLTRRVIPCLDVDAGRVVKGIEFGSIRDAGDPVEMASRYVQEGADELVFLDITASEQKRATVARLVSDVAAVLDIPFSVGGGVSSMEDARNILLSGADKVGVNTAAVRNPQLLAELADAFGRQCVVLAIDAKRGPGGYGVYTHGGKKAAGLDALEWAKEGARLGAGEILLTSMDMDGTGGGYDHRLCRSVSESVGVPVIASGGCGSAGHMADVFEKTGVDAALAATIFHYERTSVGAVKKHLAGRGIPVRF